MNRNSRIHITFKQIVNFLSCSPPQIFSIVIFGCIANEGYMNRPDEVEEFCIFNRNQNACNYAVGMGALDFLCCAAFMALDIYFPQISSVKDRKKAVLADIGVSGKLQIQYKYCLSVFSITNVIHLMQRFQLKHLIRFLWTHIDYFRWL